MQQPIAFPVRRQAAGRSLHDAWEKNFIDAKLSAPTLMKPIEKGERLVNFEAVMLPHLDAAYNLARWLTRNEQDAEDVVQEAYLRALRFFDSFTGGNGRSWMLAIVRNTCYSWMQRNRSAEPLVVFDENEHFADCAGPNPEANLLLRARRESLDHCIRELPAQFREIIVMRELEGMSYREVAEAAEVPVGTVMSRLARARKQLARCIANRTNGGDR